MLDEQDVNYMLCNTIERKEELQRRWKLLLNNKDRDGNSISSTATINRNRVIVTRDLEILSLVEELLMRITMKEIHLSDGAVKGYEKLVEPNERDLK